MGLGDFFKDVGHAAASAVTDVASAGNTVDRYINPLHHEVASLPQDRQDSSYNTTAGNAVVNHVTNPSLERASQGMTWLYDNGISQPISTALMAGTLKGGPFSAHNWAIAWHAANHISPAQALFLNQDQTTQAVNSPLDYYKPQSADLPPGFDTWPEAQQRDFLHKAGMPAVGNAYINELRKSSSFYKNASGIGDFALRWWADPVILGGKMASEARASSQVVRRPTARLALTRAGGKLPKFQRTEGGWTPQDIDRIMDDSTMGRAVDYIYANRQNPALLNNLHMARNSALGPRFGAIASTLQSPQEVHEFLRVGLGDVNAIARLQVENALAAFRIEQDTSRMSALDLMATRFDAQATGRASQHAALARQEMARLNDRVNADGELVTQYNQVLDHAHEIDEVNLSKWSFARAEQATDAQAAYRARAARGGKSGRTVTIQPTPIFSRGDSAPVDLGFQKSRLYGLGDFFSSPVTVVRSFGNARPNGFMRIDDLDKDSVAELRGQIARIPGISSDARLKMLNEYLTTTTEGERLALLKQIGSVGAAKVAEKHGLDPELGRDIYKAHLARQAGETDEMKRYSAATMPVTGPDGQLTRVRVDEFATDGGKLVLHPNLVTKLANGHTFQDLDEMDKVLARHASSFRALRQSKLGNPDWLLERADQLTSLFKFGTLFRLGYIPRVAGDDLAGQMARLGAVNMVLRAGWGVRNGITNLALRGGRPWAAAQAAVHKQGVEYADAKLAEVQAGIDNLSGQIARRRANVRADATLAGRRLAAAQAKRASMDATTPPARVVAMDRLIAEHQLALDRATRSMSTGVGAKNIQLQDLQAHHAFLSQYRELKQRSVDDLTAQATAPKVIQGSRQVDLPGGVQAPAAFEGPNGDYFMKQISSDEAIGQIFQTNKRLIHGHLMRSFDHGGKAISAAQDEALHATSWAHAINDQLVQDQLAVQAVRGASPEQMSKWLTTTAEGRNYLRRIGGDPTPSALQRPSNRAIQNPDDLANRAWHEVAEYMPTPEIRAKALEPDGVTPKFLKESMPMVNRPEVHTGQVGQSQARFHGAMNEIMDGFYKVAAQIPADRWSRHPLFNQMYEDHLHTLVGQLTKAGAYDTTPQAVEGMAKTARRLALRDTRKLVFDITHRSDVSAALRLVSPFMAATTESFQRWGRIIADRPQVVGYANDFYSAPLASGNMQDADGNDITRDGYAYRIDPATGKAVKALVPKSQRYIVGRMPKSLVKALGGRYSPLVATLGAEPSSGNFKLSQNSMDLVTQGDPWFHPGVGPIVQIPVNQFVKDKPRAAEVARKLGVLPFGPQNGGPFGTGPAGEAAGFLLPSTVKNFLTAFDTSDARYQQVKLQIMQRAAFEHEELGKPMPSASQMASMTRDYWLFSAESAFLQPMATQRQDKYQFFRDQYNELRRQDPMTADDEFLKRYGESYFVFAQSQSKNESGVPATVKAVELEKKYGDLITANPELGALIVGPQGDGPFSPEAYSYQLNTPVAPGGSEMQRTKMSASEAMAENKRREGWSKYTAMMNRLTAQLHNRGLKSFTDKGAEDLKLERSAYTALWQQPMLPDGSDNPYYNDAWSKDFSTLDNLKYDRLIPGLRKVAGSPLAADPNRSDLRVLKTYLDGREAIGRLLQQRSSGGGPKTLTAKANGDLLGSWQRFVDGLIESDTRFGDLHSRYLARDMNYDGSQTEAA